MRGPTLTEIGDRNPIGNSYATRVMRKSGAPQSRRTVTAKSFACRTSPPHKVVWRALHCDNEVELTSPPLAAYRPAQKYAFSLLPLIGMWVRWHGIDERCNVPLLLSSDPDSAAGSRFPCDDQQAPSAACSAALEPCHATAIRR